LAPWTTLGAGALVGRAPGSNTACSNSRFASAIAAALGADDAALINDATVVDEEPRADGRLDEHPAASATAKAAQTNRVMPL
jgi:hypothetical protein